MARVEGPIFALVTPFSGDDLALDEAALRASLVFLREKGVRDVVSCGTTGEFCSMTLAERKRATEIAADELRFSGNVICHISCCDVESCIDLARHAKECQCAAVLLLPPFYFHTAEPAGVEAFFNAVLAAVDMPCFLYNFPKHTGNSIPADMYARLAAAHVNVVGIKDSSGTRQAPDGYAAAVPGGKVFVGNDKAASAVYGRGLTGSITGACTALPEPLLGLAHASKAQNAQQVQAAQQAIDEWHALLDDLSCAEIGKVKAAFAARLGVEYPVACRPPLVGVGTSELSRIGTWMQARGLTAPAPAPCASAPLSSPARA